MNISILFNFLMTTLYYDNPKLVNQEYIKKQFGTMAPV